jgi:hypothetical protein
MIGEVSGDVLRYPTDPNEIKAQLFFDCALAHPSVMIRRQILNDHNLFYATEDLYAEDFGLWRRLSFYSLLVNLPEVLVRYRVSATSISRANEDKQLETLRRFYAANLNQLGLDVDDGILDLYVKVALCRFSRDYQFVKDAKHFLEMLQMANREVKCYSEPDFSKMLAKRWFAICSYSAPLGYMLWSEFKRSQLGSYFKPGWKLQIKFLIKSITKLSAP